VMALFRVVFIASVRDLECHTVYAGSPPACHFLPLRSQTSSSQASPLTILHRGEARGFTEILVNNILYGT
jgi:hypothetical protein